MNLLLCLRIHLIIGSKLWVVCPEDNGDQLCLCHPRGWQKCLESREQCSEVSAVIIKLTEHKVNCKL